MKPDKNIPQSEKMELPDYEEKLHDGAQLEAAKASSLQLKKILVGLLFFLMAALVLPAGYHQLKLWRVHILLEEATHSFVMEESAKGLASLKQAQALAPGEPAILHAIEITNARLGDKASMERLLARMRGGFSENDELLSIAEITMLSGDIPVAREAISHLSKHLTSWEQLRLVLIEASQLAREGSLVPAAQYAEEQAATLGNAEASLLKLQAARYLLLTNQPKEIQRGVEILWFLLNEKSSCSLLAWRTLARAALATSAHDSNILSSDQVQILIQVLPSLSGIEISDSLKTAELQLSLHPEKKKEILEGLREKFKNAPRSDLLELARWFNRKGFPQEVISLAGSENPRNDTDWLLLVLDAYSFLGKWNEMEDLLNSPAGSGVPDGVRHLFLARIALMLGNGDVAEEEWRNVQDDLHLERPETLAYIATYEEQIGATDQALLVYREMANRKETMLPGLIALIRGQPRNTPVAVMIPLYQELLAAAPNFTEGVGDLAYLRLLQGENLAESAATSEQLLAAQPTMLARISAAALGRLRLGNTQGAMALYDGKQIDWNTAPDPWKAVRVAVLNAVGKTAEAKDLAVTINPQFLRPEEMTLLAPDEVNKK